MTIPTAHPDYTCDDCGQTFWVTGETTDQRLAAISAWDGCECGEGR